MNKLIKTLSFTAILLTLAGCGPKYENKTEDFIIPKNWGNCEIAKIRATEFPLRELTIMRCPHDPAPLKKKPRQPNTETSQESESLEDNSTK